MLQDDSGLQMCTRRSLSPFLNHVAILWNLKTWVLKTFRKIGTFGSSGWLERFALSPFPQAPFFTYIGFRVACGIHIVRTFILSVSAAQSSRSNVEHCRHWFATSCTLFSYT